MSRSVIIASRNPVKIEATRIGFERMFPTDSWEFTGLAAPSGVSNQPMTRAETLQGALNRARHIRQQQPDAAYWVGVEGGIEADADGNLEVFAWVVVIGSDGTLGRAQTGVFYLPDEVARLVRDGLELGDADDKVFGRSNSKQQSGSIGIITDDTITRTTYYVNAVIMALIPFKKPDLTWPQL